MSGMIAFIIVNPGFIPGSAVNYAVMAKGSSFAAAFPCISPIAPAVSATGTASCASSAISAAAVASVLPILILGGSVAFSAALLSDAFRCRAEEKRRESFQRAFERIRTSVGIRAALYRAAAGQKLPGINAAVSNIKALEIELAALIRSVSGEEDILATGQKLCRAKEIAEDVKKNESEIAYLTYQKIDEYAGRIAAIAKVKAMIVETISKIAVEDGRAAEIMASTNNTRIPDISTLKIAEAGELEALDNSITAAGNLINSLGSEAADLLEGKKIDKFTAGIFKKALTIDDISTGGIGRAPLAREINVLEKINRTLSELMFLAENSEYSKVIKKFDGIKAEEDTDQRLMLYDDFVIFCEGLLRKERRRIRSANDLREMKDQLECLGTPEAAKIADEIGALMVSGGKFDMEALKIEIVKAIEEDSARANSLEYAKALKSAFEEIGYETETDFETVLINDKRSYIHKPSMKNYHVQLLSNPEKNMLQVEVVREAESEGQSEETSSSREIRDKEVQTEFCGDYEKVIRALEEKGVAVSEKNRKKPGDIKVKKVAGIPGAGKKDRKNIRTALERKIKPAK